VRKGVVVWAWCLAAAAGCLVPNPEPQTPCYAAVRGTLWPPSGEPLFVVGAQHVRLERDGQLVAETDTDRRGRFELRAEQGGAYGVVFSTASHTAAAAVTLGGCYSSSRLDLFARRR
jgi:hypothetical protein